jgi:hypothetical protein
MRARRVPKLRLRADERLVDSKVVVARRELAVFGVSMRRPRLARSMHDSISLRKSPDMLGPLPLLEKGQSIMCDRYGCATPPDLRNLDVSRRNFLKATDLTTLTMAAGPGLVSPAHAAGTSAACWSARC